MNKRQPQRYLISTIPLRSKEGCADFVIHGASGFVDKGLYFAEQHATLLKTATGKLVLLDPTFLSMGEKLSHK